MSGVSGLVLPFLVWLPAGAPPPDTQRIIKLLYFQAYLSLVQEMEWKEYLVLYEDNQGLVRRADFSVPPRQFLSDSFQYLLDSRANISLVCIDTQVILCLPHSSGEITRAPQVSVTNKDQQYESLNTTVATRTRQRLQVNIRFSSTLLFSDMK